MKWGKDRQRREDLDDLSVEAQRELAEGSPEHACELFHQLIEEWTRVQGPDGERVLVWRGFLGRALTEARRYRDAEEVLAALLVDRARVEGDDAPSTLVTRGNLARAVALGGRPHEAIELARRLVEDRTRLLGAEHHSTLDARGHIAHFHHLAGLGSEAVRLYEELLADRERILGQDHPDVINTEVNLQIVRAASTNSDDDVAELETVASEMIIALGPDHPDTVRLHAILAERLSHIGRHHEALALLNGVCDARARILGELDPATLVSRRMRANCLAALDRRQEAIAELAQVADRLASIELDDDMLGMETRATLIAMILDDLDDGRADDAADADLIDLAWSTWRDLRERSRHLEMDHPLRQEIDRLASAFDDDDDDGGHDGDRDVVHDPMSRQAMPGNFRMAFTVLPSVLLGEHGERFVEGLLRGLGPQQFAAMWSMASDVERPEADFPVTSRSVSAGTVMVIELPSNGAPNEAAMVGIHLPEPLVNEMRRNAGRHLGPAHQDMAQAGVRLLYLEHSLFGTMVGEHRDGSHVNHGFGPAVSADAFVEVIERVVGATR